MRKIMLDIFIVSFALVFIGKFVSGFNEFGVIIFNAGCSGIIIIVFVIFAITTLRMINDGIHTTEKNNSRTLTPYRPWYNENPEEHLVVDEQIQFEEGDTIITDDGGKMKMGTASKTVRISKIRRKGDK